jgi:uracil-DNA glycosylase
MRTNPTDSIRRAIARHPQNDGMQQKGYVPIFSASETSRIVLIGQAPGIKAQESQVPWNDKSGEQLRSWLGISGKDFYDETKIALIPMDFYFPGKGKSGDLPPRKGFAELWHPKLFKVLPKADLTILIGQYAQRHYLEHKEDTLTETVRHYKKYLKNNFFPIPHPSPRNNIWKAKNPWFEKEVVPALRRLVKNLLRQ